MGVAGTVDRKQSVSGGEFVGHVLVVPVAGGIGAHVGGDNAQSLSVLIMREQ